MNKIAFHLGRGKNYMHFQLKLATGEVVYVNPNTHQIILHNCKLRNQKATSRKIFEGADKERCAWIDFESYEVVENTDYTGVQVRFNPRVNPTWMVGEVDQQDGRTFEVLRTNMHNVFA